MDVASTSGLPVGAFRWPGSSTCTVIVKGTFDIGRNGMAALASRQEALSLHRSWPEDRGYPTTTDELWYASDFVPKKARTDVCLVGHVQTRALAAAHRVRLVLGGLERVAVVEQGSGCVPLRAPLVTGGMRFGPQRPATRVISRRGLPDAPVPPDFDFGECNSAPPEQQVPHLTTPCPLRIEGLHEQPRAVTLPATRPIVYLETDRGGAYVATRCDTVWIDSDRGRCVLVWRGVFALDAANGQPRLVVVLVRPGESPTWQAVASQLERAAHSCAIEPRDLLADDEETAQDETVDSERLDELSTADATTTRPS